MTSTTNREPAARSLPADLTAVALIDAPTCAAAGAMSVSWWHEEVRVGRAPAPAIRNQRCTRWRLADVRAFWAKSAEPAAEGAQAAEALKARATKASTAAREPAAVAKAKATRARNIAARTSGGEV